MKPIIVNKKNRQHYVVRPFRAQEKTNNVSQEVMNGILSAKTVGRLLFPLEQLSSLPLLPLSFGSSLITKKDFIDAIETEVYLETTSDSLRPEVYFDSNPPSRKPESPLGSRLISHLMYKKILTESEKIDDFLLVEPLADWVFARNFTSIISRLLGYITNETINPLAEAGFNKKRQDSAYSIPILEIPPSFNKGEKVSEYCSLLAALAAPSPDKNKLDLGRGTFVKAAEAEDEKKCILYLCIEDGSSQDELAKRTVEDLVIAAKLSKSLKPSNSTHIGWSENIPAIFATPAKPSHNIHSLFAQFVHRVAYRNENEITFCKDCGCAILKANKGPKRDFCSSTCRMRYTRRGLKVLEK